LPGTGMKSKEGVVLPVFQIAHQPRRMVSAAPS
jgi:hypothetical protein